MEKILGNTLVKHRNDIQSVLKYEKNELEKLQQKPEFKDSELLRLKKRMVAILERDLKQVVDLINKTIDQRVAVVAEKFTDEMLAKVKKMRENQKQKPLNEKGVK